MTEDRGKTYWLDRPGNVSKIFWGLCVLCLLLLVADAFYHKHAYFEIEEWFGFYGIFGFVAFFGLVLVGKQLRKILMRREDYYD
ncbi:MAG: hypothetical protein AB7J94_10570 [Geobacter sp.]